MLESACVVEDSKRGLYAVISKFDALTADVFHDSVCRTWRRNGQTKTWKRDAERFRVPVKYGMYRCDAITEEIADRVHLPNETCVKGR